MSNGPGKYNDLCVEAMEKAKAKCAIVIIMDGENGNGFSVNAVSPDYIHALPKMLMVMAIKVQQDLEAGAEKMN